MRQRTPAAATPEQSHWIGKVRIKMPVVVDHRRNAGIAVERRAQLPQHEVATPQSLRQIERRRCLQQSLGPRFGKVGMARSVSNREWSLGKFSDQPGLDHRQRYL